MIHKNVNKENLTRTVDILKILKANLDAVGELLDFYINQKSVDEESLLTAIYQVMPKYQEDYKRTSDQYPVLVDEKWKVLKNKPDLVNAFKSVFFTSIKLKLYERKIKEGKIELKMEDAIPGYYLCEFCVNKSLSEILPFATAIKYIQEFTKLTHSRPNPQRKKFEKLSEFREWGESLCKETHQFVSDINEDNSEYRFYVSKCYWAQALQKYGNPEIFTAMICYGDFVTTGFFNENFILTRNTTCMGGDCCDFCYHDRRIHSMISHPSDEEWEKFKIQF